MTKTNIIYPTYTQIGRYVVHGLTSIGFNGLEEGTIDLGAMFDKIDLNKNWMLRPKAIWARGDFLLAENPRIIIASEYVFQNSRKNVKENLVDAILCPRDRIADKIKFFKTTERCQSTRIRLDLSFSGED